MKTAAEFVTEYYQADRLKIATVRIQSVIKCLERYIEYREEEVKKLGLPVVSVKLPRTKKCPFCKKIMKFLDDNCMNCGAGIGN